MPPLRSVLAVLLGACSYGVLSTVVRLSYDHGFSTGQIVGVQVAFGGFALWAIAAARGAIRRIGWKEAALAMLVGAPSGVTGALYYGAVHALRSASLGVVLLFQFTWMGVVLEALRARRLPGRAEWLALLLLGIGTLLATGLVEGGPSSLSLVGVLLGLGSAASYTCVLVGTGHVALSIDPWLRSALMGTGAMLAVFAMHPPTFLVDGSLSHGLLGPGLAAALLGPVIPTLCFTHGIPRIGPSLASIVSAAELPAAMVAARLVLGEPITPVQWLGMATIVAGIVYPELRAMRPSSRTAA